MLKIGCLLFLCLIPFSAFAKCDLQYFTQNGYGYICENKYEAADLIETLPDGDHAKCHSNVGGPAAGIKYLRTTVEHTDPPAGSTNGGKYNKRYYCYRYDQSREFNIGYHSVQYKGGAASVPPPGWIAKSRNNDLCPAGANGSNPIHSALGSKVQLEEDVAIGAYLRFERRYSSSSTFTLPYGNRWSSNVERSLQYVYPSGSAVAEAVVAMRPTGNAIAFDISSANPTPTVPGSGLTLQRYTTAEGHQTGWKLYTGGSQVEYYGMDGRWQSLTADGVVVLRTVFDATGRISQLKDAVGRAISFSYDANKRLAGITEPGGSVTKYAYDPSGRLVSVTFAAGTTFEVTRSYRYEDSRFPNALTGIIDESNGRAASWLYDESARGVLSVHGDVDSQVDRTALQFNADGTTTVTNPLGATNVMKFVATNGVLKLSAVDVRWPLCGLNAKSTSFDSRGFPDVDLDFSGNTVDRKFDHRGLLEQQVVRNAAGEVERVHESVWDSVYSLPVRQKVFDGQGTLLAETAQTYDNLGRLLSRQQIDGQQAGARVTSFTYCDEGGVATLFCPMVGQLLSISNPSGGEVHDQVFVYYATDDSGCASVGPCDHRIGDLWRLLNGLGQSTVVLSYDRAGRPTSILDANNQQTDYTYHPRGWLTSIRIHGDTTASDRVTTFEYWPTGLLKQSTDPDGVKTLLFYDAAHRLTRIEDGAGNAIVYTLDPAGNRVAEETRDSNGTVRRSMSRVFDALGQLVTVADASANPTDSTYDANGNVTAVTDALGRVTENSYDALRRLTKVVQDVGGIAAQTQMSYDALDRVTQVVDPKGLATTYSYNGFGDLETQVSPDTGTTQMTYDAAGNVATRTDARGITARYSYDALNRVTAIQYPTPTNDIGYVYDTVAAVCPAGETFSVGRLSYMTDASGRTDYCYNRFGEVVRKVQQTNGVSLSIRYSYTPGGRLASLTYPDGTVADYVRNALGRISEIGVTPASGTREVLLTDVGYLPFGPSTGWRYGNGRTMVRNFDQDYRPIGIADSKEDLKIGLGYDPVGELVDLASGDQQAKLQYDTLGRLTHFKDALSGATIDQYTYDSTGNRTSSTNADMTTRYEYLSDSHRLESVGGRLRTYDATGNTTSIAGIDKEFVYDDTGRTITVKHNGIAIQSNSYNSKGERTWRGRAGEQISTIYEESGQWIGDYSRQANFSPQVIWMDELPVGSWSAGVLSQLEPDHIGTPRVVVDVAKDLPIWTWDVVGEVFGATQPNEDEDGDGVVAALDMRFPGQRADVASGAFYNYQRDYDPSSGRYLQSDPIGLLGGSSTYGYVAGSPLRWSDPTGLVRWDGKAFPGTAGISVVAGGLFVFDLTSQCVNGKRARVLVRAKAIGFGGGWKMMPPATATAGSITFQDYLPVISPRNFSGLFYTHGAGLNIGATGYGCNGYQMGSAWTPAVTDLLDCGGGVGADVSANILWGKSEVVGIQWSDCSECDPVDTPF